MRKSIVFIGALALVLASCGGGSSTKSESVEADNMLIQDSIAAIEATDAGIAAEATVEESQAESEDWDSILDEYETFITDYISLMKKAKAGDMSAMTEYASCLEKANSLGEKLEKASTLTSSQISRMTKLQAKIVAAASE
ncbi:MAG: hypothetical protein RR061_06945 [Muribaculaceae bacterium]